MEEKEKTGSHFKPFRRMNPGVEHLVAMLIEYRAAIEGYRLHLKGVHKRQALLDLS